MSTKDPGRRRTEERDGPGLLNNRQPNARALGVGFFLVGALLTTTQYKDGDHIAAYHAGIACLLAALICAGADLLLRGEQQNSDQLVNHSRQLADLTITVAAFQTEVANANEAAAKRHKELVETLKESGRHVEDKISALTEKFVIAETRFAEQVTALDTRVRAGLDEMDRTTEAMENQFKWRHKRGG